MKNKKKMLAAFGIGAGLLAAGAVGSILFNDGRLVTHTDWQTYVFNTKDLIMIVPTVLCAMVVLAFAALQISQRKQCNTQAQYTRSISPKLGLLGFMGFLGFLGLLPFFIPTASNIGLAIPFPFMFFAFFGFFGFYYEGKMSHTMIDERYRLNAFKAEATANKAALLLIIMVTIFSISIARVSSAYVLICILLCTIGIAFGLSAFLTQYLLYRYDCEE